jgi:vacuolar-type H+-ATPase subunit E/Vma4
MKKRAGYWLFVLLGCVPLQLLAQAPEGIYTCTDAKGRKLTSDRPIPECADREQRVLNPSGTVRTIVGPSLTGPERAALEARQRREAEERARQAEEKRRERALVTRYPNQASHDKERAEALAQISVVRKAALNRVKELERQRKALDNELEFYAGDPSKVPPSLKRQVDENAQSMAVQERFIADQDAEMARVNARFDEELAKLQQLWAQLGTVSR